MYECLCGMRRVVTVKNQFASFFCEFFWDVYLTGTAEQKEMHTFELHESTFYRLLCTPIKGAKIISHPLTKLKPLFRKIGTDVKWHFIIPIWYRAFKIEQYALVHSERKAWTRQSSCCKIEHFKSTHSHVQLDMIFFDFSLKLLLKLFRQRNKNYGKLCSILTESMLAFSKQ